MGREHIRIVAVMALLAAILCAVTYAKKDKEKGKQASSTETAKAGESEQQVTEADVPAAAVAALQKLAAGAKITEFAKETEDARTFYEGSWSSASGTKTDALVTPTGDIVEIEEQLSIEIAPAAALKAAREAAGEKTELAVEKKTMILYEFRFQSKGNSNELLLTPDGRRFDEEAAIDKDRTKGNKEKDEDKENETDEDEDEGK